MICETLSDNMEGRRDGQEKKSIFEIFLCENTRNCRYIHTHTHTHTNKTHTHK